VFLYVGGIPGVGKTTVIRKVAELATRERLHLEVLGEKQVLCQIVGVQSPKEYARLPVEIRSKARKKMIDKFYEMDKKDLTAIRIRDDHFTVPREDGSYWVRPLLEDKDQLHMLAFVVITAGPELILQRRIVRGIIRPEPGFFDLNAIIRHQKIEVQIALLQARELQIPIKILENEERKIPQTATLLLRFLRKVTVKRGFI